MSCISNLLVPALYHGRLKLLLVFLTSRAFYRLLVTSLMAFLLREYVGCAFIVRGDQRLPACLEDFLKTLFIRSMYALGDRTKLMVGGLCISEVGKHKM